MGLRITSWNVNGIRNPFSYQPWRENKTFQAMFDILEADIVVMQEAKIQKKDLQDDMVLVPGWDVYFSLPRHKKGYSGVAIYTRNSKCCPIRAEEGITGVLCPPGSNIKFRDLPPDQQVGGYPRLDQLSSSTIDEATLDSEGRCMILEFPAFVLIGVYSPATRDDTRTDFRLGFISALDARVRNLVAMGKQVVLTGDLNIIRGELDTAGLLEQLRKESMTLEDFISMPSRRFLNQLVFGGTVVGERDEGREEAIMWDLCREFHPARTGMYTCWETRKNARPGNFGSRIDYVLCTDGIKGWFVDANIQEGLLGSDHCPVFATLGDVVKADSIATGRGRRELHLLDVMNPEGMFCEGMRVRNWTAKDLLPLSAKLIPHFDRRQSIKSMFFKQAAPSTTTKQGDPAAATVTDSAAAAGQEASKLASTASNQTTQSEQTLGPPPTPPTLPLSEPAVPPSPATLPTSSASSTQLGPFQKRPTEEAPSTASRPQKKSKATSTAREASRSGLGRSQTNLTSFFIRPKDPPPQQQRVSTTAAAATQEETGGSSTNTISSGFVSEPPPLPPLQTKKGPSTIAGAPAFIFSDKGASRASKTSANKDDLDGAEVIDPIASKELWSKLLGKRVAPRCEHNEPCISMVTKKAGVNCGRSFYICGRPLGPSGAKEKGTEWRCGTFIWSSDWTGGGQQE